MNCLVDCIEKLFCHEPFSSQPSSKCLIRGPGTRAKVTACMFDRLPVSHASRSSGEFIKSDGKMEREKGRAAPEYIVDQTALHEAE